MNLSYFLGKDFIQDALDSNSLIYLKEDDTTLIKIINLPNLWMNDSSLYYLMEQNVVGHLDTLSRFDDLVKNIDTAITAFNFEQNELFNKKLKKFDQWMIKVLI